MYADKIEREDLLLDWSRPAEELHRVVRVGGAWTTLRGRVFKIHEADVEGAVDVPPGVLADVAVACGEGSLRLHVVQPEGKARVEAAAWANGARLGPSERLGE